MSNAQFIISGFGMVSLNPKIYKPIGKYPNTSTGEYTPQTTNDAERLDNTLPQQYSWLGTPVFTNLEIKDPGTGLSIVIDQILMDVNMTKNIVKSKVQGLSGTVKEFISNGDFSITMRGALHHINQKEYPVNDMNTLVRLLYINNELDVVSDFLGLFRVFHVVVTGFRFPQKAGSQNMQLFEIKCLSDEPIQLKIDEQS